MPKFDVGDGEACPGEAPAHDRRGPLRQCCHILGRCQALSTPRRAEGVSTKCGSRGVVCGPSPLPSGEVGRRRRPGEGLPCLLRPLHVFAVNEQQVVSRMKGCIPPKQVLLAPLPREGVPDAFSDPLPRGEGKADPPAKPQRFDAPRAEGYVNETRSSRRGDDPSPVPSGEVKDQEARNVWFRASCAVWAACTASLRRAGQRGIGPACRSGRRGGTGRLAADAFADVWMKPVTQAGRDRLGSLSSIPRQASSVRRFDMGCLNS